MQNDEKKIRDCPTYLLWKLFLYPNIPDHTNKLQFVFIRNINNIYTKTRIVLNSLAERFIGDNAITHYRQENQIYV